jgi:hypothetical protein
MQEGILIRVIVTSQVRNDIIPIIVPAHCCANVLTYASAFPIAKKSEYNVCGVSLGDSVSPGRAKRGTAFLKVPGAGAVFS